MARSTGLVWLLCFALVAAAATASVQLRVGGQRGWTVPTGGEPYNSWAGRLRFQIGDQLLFVYPKESDSVLLVEAAAYDACNVTAYVQRFDDGSTVFTLDRSGPFFFISGNEASCRADEKLIVVVLADRTPPAPGVSPSPPSMPSPSSAPMPSPPSSAPMPSPPSSAPMPAPAATPESAPSPTASAPGPAPMGSPPSPGSMAPSPSSGSLAPSPSSGTPGPAPMATPDSPPSGAPGPAPTVTPDSPPPPGSLAPSSGTPGGVPQPPSASTTPPGTEGSNSTTPGSGAASVVSAGLVTTIAGYIGYAMFAL